MNFTGKVQRAFAMNRIPPRRISRTKILDFKTYTHDGVIHRKADNAAGSLPGSTAARSPVHIYLRDLIFVGGNGEFW